MNKKERICPNCGAPIGGDAKFCTNCGSKNEKPQKPIYKKWWLWVIVVVVLLGIIGAGGEKDGVTEPDISANVAQDEQSLPAETQTPPAETPKQEEPTNTNESQTDKDAQKQAALAIMKVEFDKILSENFGENYTLEVDDTSTTVNIWGDGIAAGAALAASGDSTTLSTWNAMLDSLSEMSKNISAIPTTLELDDNYYCCINVLNDLNKDNVLVSIVNGIVIYDVVAASN